MNSILEGDLKKLIGLLVPLLIASGCDFDEEEQQPPVICPGWSFESQSRSFSGSIASSGNTGTFLINFEQDPIVDDVRAGTLIASQPLSLSVGVQSTDMTLQMQQTPLAWSSSTKEDDMPVNYEAPQLTLLSVDTRRIIGVIKGQARLANTADATTSIENFELYFEAMAPGVEVPSDCYEASGRTERCKEPNKKTNTRTMQLECTYTCSRFRSKKRTKCFDLPKENCPASWTFDEDEDRVDCKE